MQGVEWASFAERAVRNRPQNEDGEVLRCYARVKVGKRQSHATVAASGIHVGDDAGQLAEALRERVAGLAGGDAPRAWVQVLVRGESTPYDTMVVPLDGDDDDDGDGPPGEATTTADKAIAWVLVRQGDALARCAEDAGRRATAAENRAAQLVERVAELRVEAEVARMEAAREDEQGQATAQALAAAAPLMAGVGARLLGLPGPAPVEAPPVQVEDQGEEEEIDPEQLGEEIAGILAALEPEDRARVLARIPGGGV